MSLDSLLRAISDFTGALTPALALTVFLMTCIGEFGFSIPYVLETIWLLSGYNFGTGVIPLIDLVLLWLVAQVGRQAGGMTLSYLGRFGSMPIIKFYNKHFEASVSEKLAENNSTTVSFFRRIN